MWDSHPPIFGTVGHFRERPDRRAGNLPQVLPLSPLASVLSCWHRTRSPLFASSSYSTLTIHPCRLAKQMRRMQITQFRNQTPPCPPSPICRSRPSSTKQLSHTSLAPKNQNPSRSGVWAAQSLNATKTGIDHSHEDGSEIPRSLRPTTRPTSTGHSRRAAPASGLPRYRLTTDLCVK